MMPIKDFIRFIRAVWLCWELFIKFVKRNGHTHFRRYSKAKLRKGETFITGGIYK